MENFLLNDTKEFIIILSNKKIISALQKAKCSFIEFRGISYNNSFYYFVLVKSLSELQVKQLEGVFNQREVIYGNNKKTDEENIGIELLIYGESSLFCGRISDKYILSINVFEKLLEATFNRVIKLKYIEYNTGIAALPVAGLQKWKTIFKNTLKECDVISYLLNDIFLNNTDNVLLSEDSLIWIYNSMPYKIDNRYYQAIAWIRFIDKHKYSWIDKSFCVEVKNCKDRFKNIKDLKKKMFLYMKEYAKNHKDKRLEYFDYVVFEDDRVNNCYNIIREFDVNIECGDIVEC